MRHRRCLSNILNIDRKTLYVILCTMLVFVLTLTVVYASLSTTLQILGNAEVSAANWDIHFSNPKVKSGSVSTAIPTIQGNTLNFSVVLNIPGDYYEFVVDIVNDGTIDAMIENIIKTPELTSEQAKYFSYNVTYQNGENVNIKQTLSKGTSMPIKVRVEFRKDINVSDLLSTSTTLELSLTFKYIQSDGSGSIVDNNGIPVFRVVSGNGMTVGDEVCIMDECFYVIGGNEDNVFMLSKYNLYIGNEVTSFDFVTFTPTMNAIENPTGKQNAIAKGLDTNENLQPTNFPWIGTVAFASNNYWKDSVIDYPADVYSSESLVYNYVEDYKTYLSGFGIIPSAARLITLSELESLGCISYDKTCSGAPEWVSGSSYFTGTASGIDSIWYVFRPRNFGGDKYMYSFGAGVRPVIEIAKNYFEET